MNAPPLQLPQPAPPARVKGPAPSRRAEPASEVAAPNSFAKSLGRRLEQRSERAEAAQAPPTGAAAAPEAGEKPGAGGETQADRDPASKADAQSRENGTAPAQDADQASDADTDASSTPEAADSTGAPGEQAAAATGAEQVSASPLTKRPNGANPRVSGAPAAPSTPSVGPATPAPVADAAQPVDAEGASAEPASVGSTAAQGTGAPSAGSPEGVKPQALPPAAQAAAGTAGSIEARVSQQEVVETKPEAPAQGVPAGPDAASARAPEAPKEAAGVSAAQKGPEGPAANHSGADSAASARGGERNAEAKTALEQMVSRGLSAAMQQRGGSLTMRLAPESLGAMRIQMDLQPGVVTVNLEVVSPEAHRLLSQSIESLRASLEAKGLAVEKLGVSLAPPSLQGGLGTQPHAGGGGAGWNQGGTPEQPRWQDADARFANHDAGDGRSRSWLGGDQRNDNGSGGAGRHAHQGDPQSLGETDFADLWSRLRPGVDATA